MDYRRSILYPMQRHGESKKIRSEIKPIHSKKLTRFSGEFFRSIKNHQTIYLSNNINKKLSVFVDSTRIIQTVEDMERKWSAWFSEAKRQVWMDLKEEYEIRPEAKRFAWRRGVLVTFDLEAKVTKPYRRLRF